MDILIEPTTVSYSANRLSYEITRLVANEYCIINAFLLEPNGNRIRRYQLTLGQPEYNQWGEDDTFLINWICTQCGVSPLQPPSPPVDPVDPVDPTN